MAEDALPQRRKETNYEENYCTPARTRDDICVCACKGKDDNKDTTADSTQGAGADVQDTQAGGEDTTAAEAPSGDSTAAPSGGQAARRPPRVSRAALRAAPTSTLPSTAARQT